MIGLTVGMAVGGGGGVRVGRAGVGKLVGVAGWLVAQAASSGIPISSPAMLCTIQRLFRGKLAICEAALLQDIPRLIMTGSTHFKCSVGFGPRPDGRSRSQNLYLDPKDKPDSCWLTKDRAPVFEGPGSIASG